MRSSILILFGMESSCHSGGLLGCHMESNLGWHLVRVEVGGIFDNVVVSNTRQTLEGFTRWLDVDKDILLCLGCI